MTTLPCYSPREELANAVTHGLGALLSLSALVLLTVFATLKGDVYHVVSSVVFGASLVILYTMSTLYHIVRDIKLKKIFRAMDHASIFVLIAGTYTPFTLVTLHGKWGWTLFGMVWGIAVTGIVIQTLTGQKYKMSLALYLGMGWLMIVAIKPLFLGIPAGGLALLGGGGLCYTLGVVFYVWNSLFCNHAIWHLFVLGGSILHFFAVFFYVIP
ncbi:MAG: hemolysin III family protein [Desulfopila sp.]